MIERQHEQVRGLPDPDWSQRSPRFIGATAQPEVVHRHTDPLVHAINLERGNALAEGLTSHSGNEIIR
jgi:hypothetical protein